MKERAPELKSKCELAGGKIDLEQGQNQRYGTIGCHYWQGCIPCILDLWMDQAIPLILPQSQYMGGFPRPMGYRSGVIMRMVGMSLL